MIKRIGSWMMVLGFVGIIAGVVYAAADGEGATPTAVVAPTDPAGPPPSPGQVLNDTMKLAQAVQNHQWLVALPLFIMILGQLLRFKFVADIIAKLVAGLSPKKRLVVISILGGLGTLAATLATGVPLVYALLISVLGPAAATGMYEYWKAGTKPHESDLLKWAQTLTDPKAKDDAIAAIANGKTPEGFKKV
jgi:hypothetical protein